MKTQNISSLFVSVLVFVVFFGGVSVISAWTGPTVAPPSGNISTPVNLTSTSQVKSGGFWASAIGSTAGYCINGSCISTWPVFPWTPNANGVSYMGGNVGIGTASPVAKLDVNGYMRLATNVSAPLCNTNRKGAISLTNGALICICNGTSWIFDYNGAACSWSATDIAPPTVAITAPSNGATVSGTTAVSATASDNVAVVGVQFKLDGANLSTEDTTSPYSISWNTTTATNGSHTLTAVARDAAGNQATSTSVTVTVSNVVAGSQSYTVAGSSSFTVPSYNTLTVEVWGGGGGGEHCYTAFTGGRFGTYYRSCWGGNTAGSASSFNGVVANGGQTGDGAVGGTATGGDINLSGENSTSCGGSVYQYCGGGGSGLDPVATRHGIAPGGGADGYDQAALTYGGGGGGYAKKTWSSGTLTTGASYTVIVGSGGSNASGNGAAPGAPGRVTITWD